MNPSLSGRSREHGHSDPEGARGAWRQRVSRLRDPDRSQGNTSSSILGVASAEASRISGRARLGFARATTSEGRSCGSSSMPRNGAPREVPLPRKRSGRLRGRRWRHRAGEVSDAGVLSVSERCVDRVYRVASIASVNRDGEPDGILPNYRSPNDGPCEQPHSRGEGRLRPSRERLRTPKGGPRASRSSRQRLRRNAGSGRTSQKRRKHLPSNAKRRL